MKILKIIGIVIAVILLSGKLYLDFIIAENHKGKLYFPTKDWLSKNGYLINEYIPEKKYIKFNDSSKITIPNIWIQDNIYTGFKYWIYGKTLTKSKELDDQSLIIPIFNQFDNINFGYSVKRDNEMWYSLDYFDYYRFDKTTIIKSNEDSIKLYIRKREWKDINDKLPFKSQNMQYNLREKNYANNTEDQIGTYIPVGSAVDSVIFKRIIK